MLFITDKATLAIYLLLCCFITINLLSCTHTRTHKMEEARNVSSFDLCEKKNFYHPSLLCVFCHISLFSFVEENPMYLADTNYFSIHGMVCMWWLCVCPWLFVWLCLLRSERKLSPWSHIFFFYSSSLLQKNAQGNSNTNARWSVFCSAFSFAITGVVVLMHLSPMFSNYIVGTKLEGITTIILAAFWAATVSVVANAATGLAVDSNKDNTIVNGNLYYFVSNILDQETWYSYLYMEMKI